MKFLLILLLCSSCSYAVGDSPICGSTQPAHLTVFSVLRQQGLALTCGNGESLTVGASSELGQLTALLQAAAVLGAKMGGVPVPMARQAAPNIETTLDRLEQRLNALENK